MTGQSRLFTRRKALLIVLGCGLLLLLLVALRGGLFHMAPDVSTAAGRCQYLRQLGWEVDPASEEETLVTLPMHLEGSMLAYNDMQRTQGYDLNRHLGERCRVYSYRLSNYPDQDQIVLATLYVQGRRVIAGDIHSTALDGFMHSLLRK